MLKDLKEFIQQEKEMHDFGQEVVDVRLLLDWIEKRKDNVQS